MSPIDEQSPQIRVGMMFGHFGHHDETDELAVGFHGPVPGDDLSTVVNLREEGVAERFRHR